MATYRSLTLEELQALEKEFIDFLAANTITSNDWIKIQQNEKKKADGIISAFSDVVFQKILMQCRYIEKHTPRHMVSIFCDKSAMYLQAIEVPESLDLDLTDSTTFEQLKAGQIEGLQYIKSEKPYKESREIEIWKLLESGFFISNQKLYMSLFMSNSYN